MVVIIVHVTFPTLSWASASQIQNWRSDTVSWATVAQARFHGEHQLEHCCRSCAWNGSGRQHQKLWSDARSTSQTLPRLLTDNLGYGQRSPESLKGSHEFGVVDAAANRLLIPTTGRRGCAASGLP